MIIYKKFKLVKCTKSVLNYDFGGIVKYKNKKLYITASFKNQIHDKPVEIKKECRNRKHSKFAIFVVLKELETAHFA